MAMIIEAFGPEAVKLMAYTGVAALNIKGQTINSALKIPVQVKQYPEMGAEALRNFQDDMANVRFLIVDEYSMVGSKLLGYMERRCRDGKPLSNELFGGCFVYLVGDIRQLPPVGDPVLHAPVAGQRRRGQARDPLSPEVQRGRMAFASFQKSMILSVSQRQADDTLRDALDRLSEGVSTEVDFVHFSERFSRNVPAAEQQSFSDALHLYWKRADVDAHNMRRLVDLGVPVARCAGRHHGPGAANGTSTMAGGLEKHLYLAKGARVMLRANLWQSTGLVNGAAGTVVDIIYSRDKAPPEELPSVIMVRFDHYTGPTMPDGTVPIPTIVRGWDDGQGNHLSREQFPLALAWASTVHKAQGQTLDKVVVSVDDSDFTLGQVYVALSRCRSWQGLLLSREFNMDRLTSIRKSRGFPARWQAEQRILRMRL